ncbi:MAG: cytochrome C [Proteobacteria bacterium]|nr:cytochrome C [Pseudomonadota bacterium]
MKKHVWRPLYVVLGVIALLLAARYFLVPSDFGVHGKNFTYGFHRAGNINEWQAVSIKYQGRESCNECHSENVATNSSSKHGPIQCENCHGPALNHPENPEKLTIDTSRDLCLRCHSYLPTPGSLRAGIKSIAPDTHNPGTPCIDCHNPHKPDLEEMQ